MTADRTDMIMNLLLTIRGDLAVVQRDVRGVKSHISALERSYATLSSRLDRMSDDIASIKRRLDIVDPG
jgi:hypothetical protein